MKFVVNTLWVCAAGTGLASLIFSEDAFLMWTLRVLGVVFAVWAVYEWVNWPCRAEAKAPGLRPGSSMRQREEGSWGSMRMRGGYSSPPKPYTWGPTLRRQPQADAKAGWETVGFVLSVLVLLVALIGLLILFL
jgi:hypothetical protein